MRSARESYEGRTKRKLLAKTSWFKHGKRPRERSKTSDSTDPDHLPGG